MDLYQIIRELQSEKRRIELAINTLQGGREIRHRAGRKFMGAEERQEVSKRMKRYWAKRRTLRRVASA